MEHIIWSRRKWCRSRAGDFTEINVFLVSGTVSFFWCGSWFGMSMGAVTEGGSFSIYIYSLENISQITTEGSIAMLYSSSIYIDSNIKNYRLV